MPLADVRRLLDFVTQPDAECDDINLLIDRQLAQVQARLASLHALERQLADLRGRCHSHVVAGECGILRELVAAAHDEACAGPRNGKP